MTPEEWKPVPGFDAYEASRDGKIRNSKTGKTLKPFLARFGLYYHVGLNGKSESVHRIVAKTFIPNPGNYPIVNHIDGDKLNNCSDNLEWCTYSHNNSHGRYISGTNGEGAHNAKLDWMKVLAIHTLKGHPGISFTDMAKAFGADNSNIGKIARGLAWKVPCLAIEHHTQITPETSLHYLKYFEAMREMRLASDTAALSDKSECIACKYSGVDEQEYRAHGCPKCTCVNKEKG